MPDSNELTIYLGHNVLVNTGVDLHGTFNFEDLSHRQCVAQAMIDWMKDWAKLDITVYES